VERCTKTSFHDLYQISKALGAKTSKQHADPSI
jgi:hypothetical protein